MSKFWSSSLLCTHVYSNMFIRTTNALERDCEITHLSRMKSAISNSRTSPYIILGLLGGIFHFYSNLDRTICKQTVESLIRRRVLRRLFLVCTVCQRPIKRTLGLYGLRLY